MGVCVEGSLTHTSAVLQRHTLVLAGMDGGVRVWGRVFGRGC